MTEKSEHQYLDEGLPGFSEARALIKASGDPAIRHIYVHGHLTAHSNGCTSESVETICPAISDFLLNGIRDDFARRLKLAKASVHA